MNEQNHNSSWMVWLMAACCLMPILLLVFVGGQPIKPLQMIVIGVVILFTGIHIWRMNRSRTKKNILEENNPDPGSSNKSCH